MLYLGPYHFPCDTTFSAQAPARRARANILSTMHAAYLSSTPSSQHVENAITNLAALPSYQFFPALSDILADPDMAFLRGIFKAIRTDEIDLPPPRPPPDPTKTSLWIDRPPPQAKLLFTTGKHLFTDAVLEHISERREQNNIPQPKTFASHRQYVLLLDKAEEAGMINWVIVPQQADNYSRLAEDIEMTLFAVSKSATRSRLISWPRVQNEAMPLPPYTSLPHPTMFEAFRMFGSSPGAFSIDISNMFHNVTMPFWLSHLLPLRTVPFSDLAAGTQKSIAERIDLRSRTNNLTFRPTQATMPMGFKWAVFVAHNFVASCFQQSFRLLKSTIHATSKMQLSCLRAEHATFTVCEYKPLLLHIIDDAVAVTVDWPPNLVKTWHRIARRILHLNGLPVSLSNSSDPGIVTSDFVHFIGCVWNLSEGIIMPADDKLKQTTWHARHLLHSASSNQKDWERVTGKLLWFAMLNGPLLASAQSIFYCASNPSHTASTKKPPRKRELRTLTALLPLARVEVHLLISNIIVAFDASTLAGAVMYTIAPPDFANALWMSAQHARLNTSKAAHGQLDEVVQVAQQCKWKCAFNHFWKKEEHINCLGAATAVLAAEWFARSRITNTRVILLTDSLVTLGVLQKGRSSSPDFFVELGGLRPLLWLITFGSPWPT